MKKLNKKLVSLLTAATVFSPFTALASPIDDYKAAMSENITSAKMEMTMYLQIDEMSDEIKKLINISDDEMKIAVNMDMAMKASEDMKKIQIVYDMDVANNDTYPMLKTYMDIDMSDENNPKMVQIMQDSETNKYLVFDYSKISEWNEMFSSEFTMIQDMQELADKLNAQFPEKEPEYKDGKYTVTYSEKEIKDIIKATMLAGEDFYIPYFQTIYNALEETAPFDENVYKNEITDEQYTNYRNEVEKWSNILNDIQIFGKDAVTMSVAIDDNKHLSYLDAGINIDTNIYTLVTAIGKELGMTDEDMADFSKDITKENSDIKISAGLTCNLTNVNEDFDIEFPELTKENSVDAFAELNQAILSLATEPKWDNETAWLPLREFCNALGIENENITYDSGVVTVKCNLNNVSNLTLTISSDEVTVTDADGSERIFKLSKAARLEDDLTWVSVDFANILGYSWMNGGNYLKIN